MIELFLVAFGLSGYEDPCLQAIVFETMSQRHFAMHCKRRRAAVGEVAEEAEEEAP